jgi:hypothetical protein
MLSLSILVQLFGRETLDVLERAGFKEESEIVAAGSGYLAAATGIALPVAQRIVAVIEETLGRASAPRSKSSRAPKAPTRGKPVKTARLAPKAKTARKTAKDAAKPAKPPASPEDADPFVDDVGLVSWMGFSAKTSSGRSPFSVADGILDHLRRGRIEVPEADEAASEDRPAPVAGTLKAELPPRPLDRPKPAPPRTLPGSFWSYGRRAASVEPTALHEPAAPAEPVALPKQAAPIEPVTPVETGRPIERLHESEPEKSKEPEEIAPPEPTPEPLAPLLPDLPPRRRIRYDH